jgi:hypothetical protein
MTTTIGIKTKTIIIIIHTVCTQIAKRQRRLFGFLENRNEFRLVERVAANVVDPSLTLLVVGSGQYQKLFATRRTDTVLVFDSVLQCRRRRRRVVDLKRKILILVTVADTSLWDIHTTIQREM